MPVLYQTAQIPRPNPQKFSW